MNQIILFFYSLSLSLCSFSTIDELTYLSFLLYFGLTALVQMQIVSPVALFLESLSLSYHFESMGRGVIVSENLAYFLSVIVVMLGLTTVILKKR